MTLLHSSGLEGGGIPECPRVPQREIPEAPPEELHLCFHRHQSPTVGAWLTEEHAAFAAGDQNLRLYVGMAQDGP